MADPVVDAFAGMKKKKKKVVALDLDETPAPAAPVAEPSAAATGASTPEPAAEDKPAEDAGDMFADLKKKKKKKKDIPLDLDGGDAPAPDASDVPVVKKKKKKPAADFAAELDELDAEKAADEETIDLSSSVDAGLDPWVAENRNATYPELLKRFYTLLHVNNPELAGEKRRYTIVPPQVTREGTKKTSFANFVDICRRLHRQPEHVLMFLYAELGTQGSMDAAQRLILRGRFNQKQIENVLRKYIVEYVTCKICKSPDTLLGKENRLYFLTCEGCGSRRSVAAIKAGFQAQVGRRIKTG
ncbi:hypothetical protein CC85DRAFT_288862 [Cutaneotrichosporon oleaginosum]|uniref:Translation initiation factor IF2/IF5 domain-containing protein n=2 Tax=Cutaneotrichosporon oleaginosum TaxID=879819 RepID=A0A0J0XDQ0_9TREE|nr:uncharacterized protein CC85DRAFT_288862 [Cutaneotrichosporon oleaginosum]KLT39148.1 hypothetical protein CC85DRAFT_288862 [Cutaneotrichosporon oleaginosum]